MKLCIAVIFAALLVMLPSALYAQQDITPPALLDLQFEPKRVDTAHGPAVITVTVHITDDLSGLQNAALFFRKPDQREHLRKNIRF